VKEEEEEEVPPAVIETIPLLKDLIVQAMPRDSPAATWVLPELDQESILPEGSLYLVVRFHIGPLHARHAGAESLGAGPFDIVALDLGLPVVA
jgi:hypothetical protein